MALVVSFLILVSILLLCPASSVLEKNGYLIGGATFPTSFTRLFKVNLYGFQFGLFSFSVHLFF